MPPPCPAVNERSGDVHWHYQGAPKCEVENLEPEMEEEPIFIRKLRREEEGANKSREQRG